MKRVLISGANRGIGLEFARQYYDAGWYVIATCRDLEKASDLEKIRRQKAKGFLDIIAMDAALDMSVASAACNNAYAPLDLLINNAGQWGQDYPFGRMDYDEWARIMNVNCFSAMRVTSAFLSSLKKSDGAIIANISSSMGSMADNASGQRYIYRSSKAALNAVTVSFARDLRQFGITAIAVHPGWVQTDMGGKGAPTTVTESIRGMRRAIASCRPDDSGSFLNWKGESVPW